MLNLSRGTAYAAAKRGDLPGVIRIGRRLLVSRAALEKFLREAGQSGAAPLWEQAE